MKAQLLDLRKIWDKSPHNALTDLTRFRDSWLCVFREGENHISPDGRFRVLCSADGISWKSKAVIAMPGADLRDPKISVHPSGSLMINGAAAYDSAAPQRHQSFAWFSPDGFEWSAPHKIGDPNHWLWRVTWYKKIAYAIAYNTVEPFGTCLYSSQDGINFQVAVDELFVEDFPNEATILFTEEGTAFCLLRRDAGRATGKIGTAQPPYTEWVWKDLGVRIGGPNMICLPDKRMIAAVRRYGRIPWTSLNWLDLQEGKLTEFLALPSGGDTSYAGLHWHDDNLWVSYYSSHEDRTSIYLAKVQVDD
jgi:hypothetical protein